MANLAFFAKESNYGYNRKMIPDMYIFLALAFVIIILFIWVIWLQNKLGKLLTGKSKNLDDSFDELRKRITELKGFQKNAENNFKDIENKIRKMISGLETVRFNPFKGTGSGGNQSFATAFLNKDGDGVIISSLYSRDHVSIFSKSIKKMVSEHELTTEEKEALQKAKESIL